MKKDEVDQDFILRCFDLNNLSFLFGTGLSKGFGGKTMEEISVNLISDIEKKHSNLSSPFIDWLNSDLKSKKPNVEKFLDKLYVKLNYLNVIGKGDQTTESLINITRESIYNSCFFEPESTKLHILFRFLQSIIGRKSGLSRICFFTLNYDLMIEHCADELGILLNDGFDGTIKRRLNPSQFDLDFYYPSGIVGDKPVRCEKVINYLKLHGSLNWSKEGNDIIKGNCSSKNMFIYPCASKYDESIYMPFSELIRRFALAIRKPKSVLITIGYSFSDEHVNRLILQAFEQSQFMLVIVDPEPKNRKQNFPESEKFLQKIKVINQPFEKFIDMYLPSTENIFEDTTKHVTESIKMLLSKQE